MQNTRQSADAVLMIRPGRFFPNPETAGDNAFQQQSSDFNQDQLTIAARREFDDAVALLRKHEVTVHVIEDSVSPEKPDAVFPNNWISTHPDGRVALYPMLSRVRRRERRTDVIDELRRHYVVNAVVDYSAHENKDEYLEGTGSLLLDHIDRVAYASLSQRTHPAPLQRFCADFGFEPVTFRSCDRNGRAFYHTNVMMCLGTNFVLIGLSSISDTQERRYAREKLERTGRDVVELSQEQIANFAGNALELHNTREQLLVLSTRAREALTQDQLRRLEKHARIVALDLPTIELGGGSARCMMATIHLPRRV
jgi:hypothetical protein